MNINKPSRNLLFFQTGLEMPVEDYIHAFENWCLTGNNVINDWDIINELILKLQRELSVTSVVVTHDMKSAYKIGDRIIMLYDGKVIADGDAEYIKNHPHPKVHQFINGHVSHADLAALRVGGTKYQTQYSVEDFKHRK